MTSKTSRSEPDTLDEMLGLGIGESVPCPACGSRVTMPTMLAPGERQCWERDCAAIWTEDAR